MGTDETTRRGFLAAAAGLGLNGADARVVDGARGPQTRALTSSRAFKAVRAVRENRVVQVDDPDLATALSYSSVLSIPYQLRTVVPRLREALAA